MCQVVGEYTQVIIRTKTTSTDPDPCVRWQADIPKWLSVQRQNLLILIHASGGRQIYPSDYSYKDNICWSWPMHKVTGGYTQVIIRIKKTSSNPNLCVRWQADIPKWLSIQTQHLLILTHASGGRQKYPEWLSVQTQHLLVLTHASGGRQIYPAVIRIHTILLPRPVRSQVACGDTQGLSTHTHTNMLPRPMRIGWHAETPKGYSYTHLCYPDLWEVR